MALTVAEKKRRSRARDPERDAAQRQRDRAARAEKLRRKAKRMSAPFVGVDGEGAGVDASGRQSYKLLRAGGEFIQSETRLTSKECLGFLADLDPSPIYVGFYFNYDVTMILRDVPSDAAMATKFGAKWNGFRIGYTPSKEFWVKREGAEHRVLINDVGPFFQCSFVKALTDWKMTTPEQLAEIEAGKSLRPDFAVITTQIFEYNKLECELLAALMEQFREVCLHADIVPDRWQGPGWIAAKMLTQNGIEKTRELSDIIDPQLWDFSNKAYYGGRFEITRIGHIAETIYEYDINSAYPTAMVDLPCLKHGDWRYTDDIPTAPIYIAKLHFRYPADEFLCDLPIRDRKTGTIFWPTEGTGWYHSVEIEAAFDRGRMDMTEYLGSWEYHRECDCRPFGEFVPRIYAERKAIGKSTKGMPLKLGLNSLYGKLCQSIGAAPFANPVWGGMITAHCRAALIRAYTELADPRSVVMLATDGLYTTKPLNVEVGDQLGQWEAHEHSGMFLLKPGVYYYDTPGKLPKTRGVARSVMLHYEPIIRQTFADWAGKNGKGCPRDLFGRPLLRGFAPSVEVTDTRFIGRRLALARGKPETAGTWLTAQRQEKMDWSSKRDGGELTPDGKSIMTIAKRGSPRLETFPYQKQIGKVGTLTDAQVFALVQDEQPDWIEHL